MTDAVLFQLCLAILIAPLIGFALQFTIGKRLPRQGDWLTVGAIGISLASSLITVSLADHRMAAAAPSRKRRGNQAVTFCQVPSSTSVTAATRVASCMMRAAPTRTMSLEASGAMTTPALAWATMLKPITVLLMPWASSTRDKSGKVRP